MFDDIRAIKDFIECIRYKKDSTFVKLNVIAKNSDLTVYEEETNCIFSYEAGYQQYRVNIDWNVSDTVMHNIGLHASYNTNFQRFRFEENTLYIAAGNIEIFLRKE